MRYAPSTNGFYPEDNEYPNIPDDVISISDELYIELLNGQVSGEIITPNGSEMPFLSQQPSPTKERYIEMAETRRTSLLSSAALKLAPLQDAVDLGEATDEEAAALNAWKKYRVMLMRVDASNPQWPTPPEV